MARSALAQETLFALREEISRLEGENQSALALAARREVWGASAVAEAGDGFIRSGLDTFDAALGGGLQKAALHEIRSAETRDNGAASGFALSLGCLALSAEDNAASMRLLWISDPVGAAESGMAYAPGLQAHGLFAGAVLHASPRHLKDALMIAEAGLAISAFAAVIFEVYGNPARFGLTESRRLHLRAKAFKRPIFLLRERGEEEASSAATRFLVRPAPSALPRLVGNSLYAEGIGNPVFHIAIEKSRNPSSSDFFLEWNADEHRFHNASHRQLAVESGRQPENSVTVFPDPRHRQDRPEALGAVMAFPRAS